MVTDNPSLLFALQFLVFGYICIVYTDEGFSVWSIFFLHKIPASYQRFFVTKSSDLRKLQTNRDWFQLEFEEKVNSMSAWGSQDQGVIFFLTSCGSSGDYQYFLWDSGNFWHFYTPLALLYSKVKRYVFLQNLTEIYKHTSSFQPCLLTEHELLPCERNLLKFKSKPKKIISILITEKNFRADVWP